MKEYDVLLIDPPMTYFNKKDVDISSLLEIQEAPYIAFNPGLLSIGSYIKELGYKVKLKHIKAISDLEKKKEEIIQCGTPKVIGISCSYFQTYDVTLELCSFFANKYPDAIIVVGGQHAGNMPGYVLTDCPDIDLVCLGEGEGTFEDLLNYIVKGKGDFGVIGGLAYGEKWIRRNFNFDNKLFEKCILRTFISDSINKDVVLENVYQSIKPARLIDLDEMPFLHYDLYDEYMTYPCYVEESRGCYGKCKYCVAPINGGYRYKSAERFLKELERAISIYGFDNNYPFLASNFGVNVENTQEIFDGIIEAYGDKLQWSAEFRVDLEWHEYIDKMYEAGCRGFNIGMDSPCDNILRIMNKTTEPNVYLAKTKELIKEISKYSDAAICVNMMFYPGDNSESIIEVMNFISEFHTKIAAIHYSPTNVYYGTGLWNNFNYYNLEFGTTIVKTPYFDRVHIYPINPSYMFDNDEENYWCRCIEKLFSEKELFAQYHETRLTRDSEGRLTDEQRKSISQMYINNCAN